MNCASLQRAWMLVHSPGRPTMSGVAAQADPHPGNLIRTPQGQLAILDFGLMSTVRPDALLPCLHKLGQGVKQSDSSVTHGCHNFQHSRARLSSTPSPPFSQLSNQLCRLMTTSSTA